MKPIFCPRCHRQLRVGLDLSKVKMLGKLVINCGHCKKGKAVILPPPPVSDPRPAEQPSG